MTTFLQSELLQTKRLQKTFKGIEPVEAVCPLDLTIHTKELVSLVGPSGSGKSTLMNLLGLLDKPTSGQLLYNGQATEGWNESQKALFRNKSLGFVFQAHLLLPEFSAFENVLMPAFLLEGSDPSTATRERAKSLLERIGLGERLNFKPRQLSGGQCQRVAIARALINKPQLVFADEPTGALDSQTSTQVFQLLRHLHEEDGITFLIVTHDNSLAAKTKRRLEIHDGIVVSDTLQKPVE